MVKIDSFKINHLTLKPGIYLSREDKVFNNLVQTWDIRVITPYSGSFIPGEAAHTLEHLMATYFRNSQYGNRIIYSGAMACRTGFYLVTWGLNSKAVRSLIERCFLWIREFEGEIPGAKKIECGDATYHDLNLAKQIATKYYTEVLCSDYPTVYPD